MSSSCTRGCRMAAVLAVLSLVSGFAQLASAALIYSEDFRYNSANQAVSSAGWFAYINSYAYDTTNSSSANTGINSAVGSGTAQGTMYTTPGDYTGCRSLLGTSEIPAIVQSKYSPLTLSWEQWVNNTSFQVQLAVATADGWLVSKDMFTNSTVLGWSDPAYTNGEAKSLTLSSASGWYGLAIIPGTTLEPGTTQVSLPTGDILAVGLYVTGPVSSGAVVIDNFQINGVPVPEPGTLALGACGVFGLLAYAWRKRK